MSESKKEKMQADVVKGVLKLAESNDKEISLRNIAEAVGVKAPTIYYYFKNSNEIAVAVWEKLTSSLDCSFEEDKLYEYFHNKFELCEFLFFKKDSRLTFAEIRGGTNLDAAKAILHNVRINMDVEKK